MKILICSDGYHAHYFQRMAWANAFSAMGFQVHVWDKTKTNAFDMFDMFEPDIFMGQAYNLDESLIKCIYERPHLKVGLRAGDWGDHEKEVDKSRYNILFCSKKEKELLKKLKDETGKPDFVHIHYNDADIKRTHNYFETIGIKPVSLMMCADTAAYGGAQVDEKLKCDIGFVGGYWPYKGQVIDRYLTPLLYPLDRYNVKIFGNQPWGVNQYCGLIDDNDVKNLFVSAKICPNLSEPHAQAYGIDINERIFKILYAGGFCISDNVEAYKMFGDGIVIADSPDDFRDKIEHYKNAADERSAYAQRGQKLVAENHTGFHRIATIMKEFDYEDLSFGILKAYKDALNEQK
tara:strand:- start:181 stop:1224 length:1044 start_codon:yes stop_codon:yes gene_type:complete